MYLFYKVFFSMKKQKRTILIVGILNFNAAKKSPLLSLLVGVGGYDY